MILQYCVVFAVHQHELAIGIHVSPPSWWTDKEAVVHIHNGILLSYKKEHIWVRSNEEDETRAYYTKWNKSERERQIYAIASMWILKYDTNELYLQKRNKRTDIENRFVVARVEEGYTEGLGLADAN